VWLSIVPCAVLIYGVVTARSFEPSGVPSSDPGYYFLMNALNLAAGRPIVHIDQPGTPLQVIGAAVIDGVHDIDGRGTVADDVIRRPGVFIEMYFLSLVVLYALALGGLGYSALITLGGLDAATVVQALPILFGDYSRVVPVTTECLLLSVVAALCILLLRQLRHEGPSRWRAPLYGALIGFGIAVKLTFAPLLLIPLCMLNRFRDVVVYAAAILASFVISTAPIWPEYPRLLEWVINLAAHQGSYGHGPGGVAAPSTWFANLADLAEQQIVLALAVVAVVTLVVRGMLSRDVPQVAWSSRERLLIGLTLGASAQFIVTAKQPDARYLIPSVASLGLFLWLLLERAPRLRRRIPEPALLSIAVVAACVLVWSAFSLPPSNYAAMQAELNAHYRGWAVVFYAGSSSPVYALADGNRMAGAYFAPELAARYPDTYLYNLWSGQISDWEGHTVQLADISATHPGVVFNGARMTDVGGTSFAGQHANGSWPPLAAKLHETFHQGDESIAEVVGE
jgi:hypothetical protein